MTAILHAIADPAAAPPQQRIAAFAAQATFEVTRLAAGDIDALKSNVPRGTRVYVSAVPSRPPGGQIEVATQLGAAGFEPVPHIAARAFASEAELDRHLGRLVDEAGVRRMLIIGGDNAAPAGPFHAALEVIDSGLPQARGIVEIGIAGYPDGHRLLATADLDRALVAKAEAATETGLGVHIVTQFGFSPTAIVAWTTRLRDLGIDYPVRIGLAGPATLAGLMRYARVCGVSVSAQGLAQNTGLAKHLFGMVTPDAVLRPISDAAPRLGDVGPHIFSFGGLAATVRWAAAVAAGRITLDRADGFRVEPP
jgi:methylenetetrahydrofolate reductase (NADPH)